MNSDGVGEARYPNVFRPISIGPVEIANRFYLSPHGIPLWSLDSPSVDAAYYLAERAAGGCGLVMHALRLTPVSEKTVPSFTAVASMVHDNGAKIFGQLTYSAVGGAGPWELLGPHRPLLGPSSYQRFDHFATAREMTKEEIRGFINSYRMAARHLAEAGYDGIEVHHTHGMQGEQFLSPYWNRRNDEYGGDAERRMRLSIEALTAVREEIGPTRALGIRFNCDEMLPGGWDQEEAREILARFVELELIDFADLDVAVEPHQFPLGMPTYQMPKFSNESFVAAVREAAGNIPVLSALGRVTTIADAERAIAAGTVDMVGAARGLIAEPELVNKAREGRESDSRECIGCNMCLAGMRIGGSGCVINPGSMRERRWGLATFTPTERKKVVVVGGGLAGGEAARVAALRGHDVVLFEKDNEFGGQLNLWAALPGREVMGTVGPWYERQLRQLGVDIRTGTEATAASVLAEQPDTVIVATGGRYSRTGSTGLIPYPIPGAEESDFVYTPEQIITGGIRPTGKVVVLESEGLNTGPGVAEILARNGAEVEIMTRWTQPAENLIFTFEFAYIVPMLKSLGVTYSTATHIKEIGDHELIAFDIFTAEERRITDLSAVVLATMRDPIDGIARELEGKVDQLFTIGDALAPRGLMEASFEGQKFARMIGEEGAPKTFAEAYFEEMSPDAIPRPAATLLESAAV